MCITLMFFEWDERKSRINLRKHGVDFETAVLAFSDSNLLLEEDRVDESGEQRWSALGLAGPQVLMIVHVYRSIEMAKKLSASSQPEKLVRRSAADILTKPLDARQRRMLAKLAKKPESEINFSDIPDLSEEQLRVRVPKRLIAARLDVDVVDWLKSLGIGKRGYSGHINTILRAVMNNGRRKRSRALSSRLA